MSELAPAPKAHTSCIFGAALVFGAFWSVMRMGPPDGGDNG